jgi:hypothetical protein
VGNNLTAEPEAEQITEPGFDPSRPNPARMYAYVLGGKVHFPADRAAAEKVLSVVPHGAELARANRRFVIRAAGLMAEAGIAQFIDLGPGIPASPAVHHAVRAVIADARVLYADNDPVAVRHSEALLATNSSSSHAAGHGQCWY